MLQDAPVSIWNSTSIAASVFLVGTQLEVLYCFLKVG